MRRISPRIVARRRRSAADPRRPVRKARPGGRSHPAAARRHPREHHRRRPRHRRPLWPTAAHLRRLHRQRPRPRLHRGHHSRRGAAPLRQHPHRDLAHGPADHALSRGGAAGHPHRLRRRSRRRGDLLRRRRHRRHQQAHRHHEPAGAGRPRRPLRLDGAHPGRGAPGGVHRSLRAPLQRAALARVHRRRGGDRRGHRRPHRPGAPRAGTRAPPRPATEDRQLLGGLQRHRHRLRHPRAHQAAAPHGALAMWDFAAAGALREDRDEPVGGRRRRRPRRRRRKRLGGDGNGDAHRPPRTPSSSRRTSSSAAPAPRAC